MSLFLLGPARTAPAEVEVISDQTPPAVFAGSKQGVSVQLRNLAAQPVEIDLRYRLYQASAATLAPFGEVKAWNTLPLGAKQTAVELFEVELPPVRGEVAFHIVWFEGDKKLGTTRLEAFPDDLLTPLATLAGDVPLGLFDPEEQLRPAFKSISASELKELEDLITSESKLVIIAPMSPHSRPPALTAAVKKKAASGGAVVWIQPVSRGPEPVSSAYVVREGLGNIVVAQASLVANFAQSPRAQLSLVRLAELATARKKLELPADPQP